MSGAIPELLDRTKPVRAGEEIDLARLGGWLAAHGLSGSVQVEQFPSGHSNLTYLVRAGAAELVLRRPPFGSQVKSAHDMGREFRVLSKLHAVWPRVPRPIAFCDDESVLGARFYVMERVRGLVLRRALPAGFDFPPERARALSESFIDTLAELHTVDFAAAGLGDLGKPEGYVRRQVEGWTRRYEDARTDAIAEVDRVSAWLAERIPPERGAALIHNDFKYDNLVLDLADPTKVLAVLDWEMSTLGDPLMDLGTALAYWSEAGDPDEERMFAFGPTFAPGSLTRHELAARYGEKVGRDPGELLYYYAFALWKTAVVAQQIYARYQKGLTKDDRFQAMIVGVRVLSAAAVRAIDRGRM